MSEFADIIYIPQHCLGPEEALSQRLDSKEIPYIRKDKVDAILPVLAEAKNLAAVELGVEAALTEKLRAAIVSLGGQP